ncbi:hypothetical protein CHS0354_015266 [Potamilus streckersoni]|uniref:Uncharacterized protein n=1 Tax=Potamilus streckersoni TaxID=2493646 RepID=A0AAE0RUG6_9BIVA|nr:hypothetical protein CHS0354_015266 [Potamilus streckersoni]
MNGGFRSVEYKLTEANNYGIRNWKDSDNKIKSVEYKLTKENNLGLRNWKSKNKLNDTTVLPKSNTKEITKTKTSPPSAERKQLVQKPDQQTATTTKVTPVPQKPPQSQPKSIVTNGNNAVRTETSISKTNMSPTDTKILTQSPNEIPATRDEEVKQPAKTTDDFTQSYQRTPRGNPEFYTDPRTGERYPNYQRPLHAWQTPYHARPRFEWQISEPMQSPRFVAQNFIPPGYLSMMDPLYYPMQRPMIMVDPMVVRPSSFTQIYGPYVLPMYPQYSYNMPRRIY